MTRDLQAMNARHLKQVRGRKLEGKLTDHHRFLLKMLWEELAQQEELIAELDAKIEEQTRPFAAEIERPDAIPGVDHRVAEVLLAEVNRREVEKYKPKRTQDLASDF